MRSVSVSHGISGKFPKFGVHFLNSLIAEERGRAKLSFWIIFIWCSKVIKEIARRSSIIGVYSRLYRFNKNL